MAGRFQAPVSLTLPELNAQALTGDADAALRLADLSTMCETAWEFVERYVPQEDAVRVFDTYVDAFVKSRTRALLDTLELPSVGQTNLKAGWGG